MSTMEISQREYCRILEVEEGSTKDEIRSAYKRQALKWHPDKHMNSTAATQKYQEIKAAYEMLMMGPESIDLCLERDQPYDLFAQRSRGFSNDNGSSSDLTFKPRRSRKKSSREKDVPSSSRPTVSEAKRHEEELLKEEEKLKNQKEKRRECKKRRKAKRKQEKEVRYGGGDSKKQVSSDEEEEEEEADALNEDSTANYSNDKSSKAKAVNSNKSAEHSQTDINSHFETDSNHQKEVHDGNQQAAGAGGGGGVGQGREGVGKGGGGDGAKQTEGRKTQTKTKKSGGNSNVHNPGMSDSESDEETQGLDVNSAFFAQAAKKQTPPPAVKTNKKGKGRKEESESIEDMDPQSQESRKLAVKGNEMASKGNYHAAFNFVSKANKLNHMDCSFRNLVSLKSLWIGNLQPTVTKKDLKKLFKPYGEVSSMRRMPEKFCAFVNYKDPSMASKAMDKLQGRELHGKHLLIKFPDNPIEQQERYKNLILRKPPTQTSASKHNNNNVKKPKQQQQQIDPGMSDSESDEETQGLDMNSAFFAQADKKQTPPPAVKTTKMGKGRKEESESIEDMDPQIQESRKLAVKGIEMVNEENYHAAIKYFRNAIELNPMDFRFFGNRSFCYDHLQMYDHALSDAVKAIDLDKTWPKGHYRKGRALSGLKLYSNAEAAFEHVLKLDKNCAEAVQELRTVRVYRLMEMGFGAQQSEAAILEFDTVQAALENMLARGDLSGEIYFSDDEDHITQIISKSKLDYSNPENLKSLWIGNLQPTVTKKELWGLFKPYGEVLSMRCLPKKCCAFVNYKDPSMASKAMEKLQNRMLHGKHLLIKFPDNPKEQQNSPANDH